MTGALGEAKSKHRILCILLHVSNCLCPPKIVRYKGKADLQQATTTRAVTEAQLHFFLTSAALHAVGRASDAHWTDAGWVPEAVWPLDSVCWRRHCIRQDSNSGPPALVIATVPTPLFRFKLASYYRSHCRCKRKDFLAMQAFTNKQHQLKLSPTCYGYW